MEVLLFDAVTFCDRIFSTSSAANRSIGEIIFVFMIGGLRLALIITIFVYNETPLIHHRRHCTLRRSTLL